MSFLTSTNSTWTPLSCFIMPPSEESGNRLGWPQTWVKLGYVPRNVLTDQPDQAADSVLLRAVIRTRQTMRDPHLAHHHRLPGSPPEDSTAGGTRQMQKPLGMSPVSNPHPRLYVKSAVSELRTGSETHTDVLARVLTLAFCFTNGTPRDPALKTRVRERQGVMVKVQKKC